MRAKTLKPHQLDAIAKLDNGKILCGDVGTGKTLTSLGYYVAKERGQDIYVITTAKKRDSLDWEAEAASMGIGTHKGISLFGQLHVDSWNNIHKYTEVKDAFFIFDEQRLVGSGAWVRAFYKIAKANRWILLSATPGDVWLDYIPAFVANGFYKNATEFKREHVIYTYYSKFPKVDRYIGVSRLQKHRAALLVDMPYERHTSRVMADLLVKYDKDLYEQVVTKRWHVYEKRPLRDKAELFSVARRVVNSDSSRLAEIRELMTLHPKLIVFYNFDYELDLLRTLGDSTLKPSETSGEDSTGQSVESRSRKMSTDLRFISSTGSSPAKGPMQMSASPKDVTAKLASSKSSPSRKMALTPSTAATTSERTSESWQTQRPASTTLSERSSHHSSSSSSSASAAIQTSATRNTERRRTTSTMSSTTSGSTPSRPSPNTRSETASTMSLTNGMRTGSVRPDSTKASNGGSHPSAGSAHKRIQIAEWNGHKHEPIPDSDSWVYLVQYTAGAEGWNCIETDAMCFYSLTYSYRAFHQSQGRIDRLDTPFSQLKYYVLVSQSTIDTGIRKSLRAKKNFNESSFQLNKT